MKNWSIFNDNEYFYKNFTQTKLNKKLNHLLPVQFHSEYPDEMHRKVYEIFLKLNILFSTNLG